MSKKDEALKLALEALLSCSAGDYSTGHVIHPSFDVDAVNKAIEAIDALDEQGCDYCNHPQYAGTKCKNCGREQPAQPSKPWVGLTDKERDAILDREFKQWWSRHDAVCRAIEAKLKEKNA